MFSCWSLRGHDWGVMSMKTCEYPYQDNEFIRGGYRPELYSYSLCLNSVLRVHNETANIWTHLLGSALFAALIATYFSLR